MFVKFLSGYVESHAETWTKLLKSHRNALSRKKACAGKSGAGAKPYKPWRFETIVSFVDKVIETNNETLTLHPGY